jgi:uncharacterized membrane protein YidH (DUF202 family)
LIIFSVGLDVITFAQISSFTDSGSSQKSLAFGCFYVGLIAIIVSGYGYYILWKREDIIRNESTRTKTLLYLTICYVLSGLISFIGIIIDGIIGYGKDGLGDFEICGNDKSEVWKDGWLGDDWLFGPSEEEFLSDCAIPRNTSDCYCNSGSACWEFQATSSGAFDSSDCGVFLREHAFPARLATTFSFCILLIPLVMIILLPCSYVMLKPPLSNDPLVVSSASPVAFATAVVIDESGSGSGKASAPPPQMNPDGNKA